MTEKEAVLGKDAFEPIYRALNPEAAQFYRLLSLHPGPNFSTSAAAALTAANPDHARHLLSALVDARLLEQNSADRYTLPESFRLYAADQASGEEVIVDQATLVRIVTWYLHGAQALQAVLSPNSSRVSLDALSEDIAPVKLDSVAASNDWYSAERANLVAATQAAAEAGSDRIAWQLAATLHHIY